MTALEASASTRTRAAIRAQAQVIDHVTVSDRLIRDVLLGWPARADSVRVVLDAARASGVDVATVPARTDAERAEWTAKRQGKRPCPACAAKDAELAAIRARVAELEARPVGGSSVGRSLAVVPIGPEAPTPAADPPTAEAPTPPRPAPQPDATTRALERAVGRPCTVRVDMGDGVLVRAAEVAG
jgi:hypothetical protein